MTEAGFAMDFGFRHGVQTEEEQASFVQKKAIPQNPLAKRKHELKLWSFSCWVYFRGIRVFSS